MKRRSFLKLMMLALMPLQAFAAVWNKNAFEAKKLDEALQSLGFALNQQSAMLDITAPDRAENGAVVQVELKSSLPNTERLILLVEDNPTPLIADFKLGSGTQAKLVTRIKMAQTSNIILVAIAGGQAFYNRKLVTVLEDGCGGTDTDAKFESSIKMRARLNQDTTEIKAIIVHPMTTGRAKNNAGVLIPAHFIQDLVVTLNGKTILEMQSSTAISKNPYLTFYSTQAKINDEIVLNWQDNMSNMGQGKVNVSL